METNLDRVELTPGPFRELIGLIVEDGRRSVEENEIREERIQGCLSGLERCEEMRDLGVLEFELEVGRMRDISRAMKVRPGASDQARRDYWHQRCATAQLEYCYDILRAAHKAEFGVLPDNETQTLSARAVYRYNILTMKLAMSAEAKKAADQPNK